MIKKLILIVSISLLAGCGDEDFRSCAYAEEIVYDDPTVEEDVVDVEEGVLAVEEVVVEQRSVYDDIPATAPTPPDLMPCSEIPESYRPGGVNNPYGRYPLPACKGFLITKEECI